MENTGCPIWGGIAKGFEVPPLNLGLASTTDPTRPEEWTRLETNPILTTQDSDTGWWEDKIQFASHLVRDEAATLGHPFLLVYNAKGHRDNANASVWLSPTISFIGNDHFRTRLSHATRIIESPVTPNC